MPVVHESLLLRQCSTERTLGPVHRGVIWPSLPLDMGCHLNLNVVPNEFMRQEVDGPLQGKQQGFVPCGQKLQNINSRTIERGGWAHPRKEIRDNIFLILQVKKTFLSRKLLGGQKGSGAKLPIGLYPGINLG